MVSLKSKKPAKPKKPRKVRGATNMKNNKLILGVIAGLAILLCVGVFSLLNQNFKTETYYVLANDVPTRTQITPEMLEPVVTSGTAPTAAKSIADVQSGMLYSKFPLIKGDIVTESNAGGFEDISTGVPDSWVVTSFSVPADNAVNGRIQRGMYFDMMLATEDGTTYPFINVLTLDTSISLNGASSANAADTEEAKAGQTSQYTVGMSPADAAKLQSIMTKYGQSVKLLLSPRENEYKKPNLSAYAGQFNYDTKSPESPKNMGEGTDYTFTPIERDKFGKPTSSPTANCSQGNAKLDADTCKEIASSN